MRAGTLAPKPGRPWRYLSRHEIAQLKNRQRKQPSKILVKELIHATRMTRGQEAQRLWNSNLKWREVGERMGISGSRASNLAKFYCKNK